MLKKLRNKLNNFLWIPAIWFLKKIDSKWYARLKAEEAMLKYGFVPMARNGWGWVSTKRKIVTAIGYFLIRQDRFVFCCDYMTIYGDFHNFYMPLKKGKTYELDELITLLTLKLHEQEKRNKPS